MFVELEIRHPKHVTDVGCGNETVVSRFWVRSEDLPTTPGNVHDYPKLPHLVLYNTPCAKQTTVDNVRVFVAVHVQGEGNGRLTTRFPLMEATVTPTHKQCECVERHEHYEKAGSGGLNVVTVPIPKEYKSLRAIERMFFAQDEVAVSASLIVLKDCPHCGGAGYVPIDYATK